jgi:hypothetical protein
MKRFLIAASVVLGIAVLGLAAMDSPATKSLGSTASTVVVPTVAAAEGVRQELRLVGVRAPKSVAGFRVYLNPTGNQRPTPESEGYVGTLYFSHSDPAADSHRENFVVPLSKEVSGKTRVTITPMSVKGETVSARVDVDRAEIRAVDNRAFQ